MADSYFCLDIGENFIKVLDARSSQNQLDILGLGQIEGEANFFSVEGEKVVENQSSKIGKLVSNLKIAKKNVGVVIPDSVTYSQILEMPRLNEKELISAIKYQADQFIPMPIEETNIDLEILSENEKENKLMVLMVAAPKKIIEKVQRVTEMAGFIPESVENELSATARFMSSSYKNLYPKGEDGVLIVNLAYSSTSLYYFNPQTALLTQNHTFNIGYSLFAKEIQINLNTDNKKAIDILSLYDGQQKSFISVETIILPLLKEFIVETKRFISLINEKYHSSIKNIYVMNDAFRFIYLPKYLQTTLALSTDFLSPYMNCKKSPLVETNKNTLPLYIATIGGNLR